MMEQDRHIGQQIGNYRLVEQLDCGSFGCVYRAEHLILKTRTVAIKILHAHLATQQKREGFFQEAELLEMLKHPHILPIIDVGIQDGFPYLVTEYCPQGSLHRRLKRQHPNPLPMEEAITTAMAKERKARHADVAMFIAALRKSAQQWFEEGTTFRNLKRYQEALAAYEQAIHLDPNFAVAYYSKGLALEALGKKQQAQQAYERAKQLGYSG